jgi:NADH-quinone oxidoreductase subunit M
MIYERYHTRAMADFSGLARIMPVWAFFMVFFTMSSVALPGLNGFVSEFLCLAGTFWSGQEIAGIAHPGPLGPWYAAVAGLGMILAAIYLLYLLGRIVWGPLHYPQEEHDHHPHGPRLPRDLTAREILVLTPIAIVCLALGVRPGLILDPIDQPIREVLANVHDSSTDRAWLAEAPAADSTPIVAEVSRD